MSIFGYDMTRLILSFIPPCYNKKNLSLVCKEWDTIIAQHFNKQCRIYKTNTKTCLPPLSFCLLHHSVINSSEKISLISPV